MNESRTLKVDPRLIFDVISKQAGTVAKAIAEGVMNSIDAKATDCRVTFDGSHFTITDNGKGFVDRREIELFFETFGTPHEKGDCRNGRFRIGRGQIFSYGHNLWKSGSFTMEVDLKNRGLEYGLIEADSKITDGCSIEVALYEPMSPNDYDATMRDIKELMAFAEVPVFLNGQQISKDRSAMVWDHEDDDCLIKFSTAAQIKVYNLGIFVRPYYAGQFGGRGGVVVSKQQLEVNMARSDILTSQCEVWKRVRKVLADLGGSKAKASARTTNEMRQFTVRQFVSGAITPSAFSEEKVFPTFPSGYCSLRSIVNDCALSPVRPLIVLTMEDNDRLAEAVVRAQQAKVLKPEVLEWFGVESTADLMALICRVLRVNRAWEHYLKRVESIKVSTLNAVAVDLSSEHTMIHRKEWTKLERCIVTAMDKAQHHLLDAINRVTDACTKPREIRIGLSNTALAWTNGSTTITFDRAFINDRMTSLPGLSELIATLLHEYLHHESDSGSHLHDIEFYESFHNVMLEGGLIMQQDFIKAFATSCRASNTRLPYKLKQSLSSIFELSKRDADGDDAGDDDGAQTEKLPSVLSAA